VKNSKCVFQAWFKTPGFWVTRRTFSEPARRQVLGYLRRVGLLG